MINIAICDDNKSDLASLEQKVKKYLNDNNIHGEVVCYEQATTLLSELSTKNFDLYILDVVMPEVDGIALGKAIRDAGKKASVIYITSSVEYALDAFKVHAIRYIEKPIDDEEFKSAMDFFCDVFVANPHTCVMVRDGNSVQTIFVEDVMYIENHLRSVTYYQKDGKKVTATRREGSFEDEVSAFVSTGLFLQSHKSFFVNMDHISSLKQESIVMDDGREIPIARKRLAEVKNGYMEHISEVENLI